MFLAAQSILTYVITCSLVFALFESASDQKINLPVDHEPAGLKKNELHHENQRGRISLETDFEGITTIIWK